LLPANEIACPEARGGRIFVGGVEPAKGNREVCSTTFEISRRSRRGIFADDEEPLRSEASVRCPLAAQPESMILL